MQTTLTILAVPGLAGLLLTLDALWPLSAHVALGAMALVLGVLIVAVVKFEKSK